MMRDMSMPPSDKTYSHYLKIEEHKNKWIEYWVVIQDNCMCLYSDECSEESGEEAIKTIELSCETRCELVKRRTYHYRFKVISGSTSIRMKCDTALHRQQWISSIIKASGKAKDRVIELSASFNSEQLDGLERHKRSLSTESQQSQSDSDFETGFESSSGLPSPQSESTEDQVTTGRQSPSTPTRRGSKSILRRLSIKKEGFMRRSSKTSLRDDSSVSDMSSPNSPASPARHNAETVRSPKPLVDPNKVFVNTAFVPSPSTSPKLLTKHSEAQEVDLIDMSDF